MLKGTFSLQSMIISQPHPPVRRGGDTSKPDPSPNASENEEDSKMGSALSLLKTLIVPALISLILYVFISYLIVPAWKRYRGKYSHYLPLNTISTRTSSFRQRVQSALVSLLLPSSWRSNFGRNRYTVSGDDASGSDFDEDDGEELYEVDENRREALSLDARRSGDHGGRRLSRDLKEGFKDDSDDEDDLVSDRQHRTTSR